MSLRTIRAIAPLAAMVLAASAVVAFAAPGDAANTRQDDAVENTDAAINFRNDMRQLWEDHVTWTRLAVISLADDRPDQGAAVERLLANQDHIGDAVAPFYGEAAGDQLTALLKDHIVIAADLILAARDGDAAAAATASERWYANGDEIAAFLSSANPEAWPLDHMKQMMRGHLDLTLAEAQARLAPDYDADVVAYDSIHGQILEMADMLSLGIINQFPKRFR